MRQVRNKNTKIELVLRKALWALGMRYRIKSKLPGKPDVVFPPARLAIFVDGCFWHGCPIHGQIPETNTAFWKEKIEKNIARDIEVRKQLEDMGWHVVRFWEHEISQDLPGCISTVSLRLNPLDKGSSYGSTVAAEEP